MAAELAKGAAETLQLLGVQVLLRAAISPLFLLLWCGRARVSRSAHGGCGDRRSDREQYLLLWCAPGCRICGPAWWRCLLLLQQVFVL